MKPADPSALDSDGDERMPDVNVDVDVDVDVDADADADADALGLHDDQFAEQGDHLHDEEYDEQDDDEQDEQDEPDEEEDEEEEDEDEEEFFGNGGGLGINLRTMASVFSDVNNDRFPALLAAIKPARDPSEQLNALEELAGLLSISQEESLLGQFPTQAFVRELVRILDGQPATTLGSGRASDEEQDSEIASILRAVDEDDGTKCERQVLACRCLANLIEALPYAARTVVNSGGVNAMVSKLVEIEFIDLAEQVLSTLEKISHDHPHPIVEQGGLMALLLYLDFFNLHVQRTALNTVANCCRKLYETDFGMVVDTIPLLAGALRNSSDRRSQEASCKSIVRIIERYRSDSTKVAQLVTPDLCTALEGVLAPSAPTSTSTTIATTTMGSVGEPGTAGADGSTATATTTTAAPVASIPSSMVTDLVRALTYAVRISPQVSSHLLQSTLSHALYAILTGSRAPTDSELGNAITTFSAARGKMTILQNLSTRPKDQLVEALSLTLELLPLPSKTGVFDPRNYTLLALERVPSPDDDEQVPAHTRALQTKSQEAKALPTVLRHPADRAPIVRLATLMFPVLLEIHTASVTPGVRYKAIVAILKIAALVTPEQLRTLLEPIQLSPFLAAVLSSSNDGPAIVQGSLQVVELLIVKLGVEFYRVLKREGVMYEVNQVAQQELSGTPGPAYPKSSLSKAKATTSSSLGEGTAAAAAAASTQPSQAVMGSEDSALAAGAKKKSLTPTQQTDLNIVRARMIQRLYAPTKDEHGLDQGVLQRAKHLADRVRSSALIQDANTAKGVLNEVVEALQSDTDGLAGWELLQSGLIDALLHFSTAPTPTPTGSSSASVPTTTTLTGLPLSQRKDLFATTFFSSSYRAATRLVQRLQENLSRTESVPMASLTQSLDEDTRRTPGLSLTKQMRLKLISTDPEIPRSCTNLMIGLHAVAPLSALDGFLRSKLQVAQSMASMSSRNNRLSSVLAALAAAGGDGSSPGGSGSGTPTASRVQAQSVQPSLATDGTGTSGIGGFGSPAPAPPTAGGDGNGEMVSRREVAARALMQGLLGGDELDSDHEEGTISAQAESEAEVEAQEDQERSQGSYHSENEVDPTHAATNTKSQGNLSTGTSAAAQPNPSSSRPSVGPSAASAGLEDNNTKRSTSYSGALQQSLNTDEWYLEFRVGDQVVQLEDVVFGAVYRDQKAKDSQWEPDRTFWTTPWPITFRKVKGPTPTKPNTLMLANATPTPTTMDTKPEVFPAGSEMSQAMLLLGALNEAFVLHAPQQGFNMADPSEPSQAATSELTPLFVNNKLTAKLNRQLEEPLLAASHVLPLWAQELPRQFPFLFPFATRFAYLQATAFGSTRTVARWQSILRSTSAGSSAVNRAREEAFGYLGRLSRQKVRIGRDRLIDSVVKICSSYANPNTVLEVEYFDEVGTGLGPTLEFYSLASRAFARKDTKMWLGSSTASTTEANPELTGNEPQEYVFAPQGLFPLPLSSSLSVGEPTPTGQKQLELFRALGTFVAKSLLDSRIIHIDFNPVFWGLVVGQPMNKSVRTIAQVDQGLASSLEQILALAPSDVESLGLDFTLPGAETIELCPGGKDQSVTGDNAQEYIELIAEALLGKGTKPLIEAFTSGFAKLMDARALGSFTPAELTEVFGNAPEDWSQTTLAMHIKPDHGFTPESPAYQHLLTLMASFDSNERRVFLSWLTGSPKLPIGGFKALSPALTVVKRPHEQPLQPDDYLPSVMTCVNYLKLPNYSSAEVMAARVRKAMHEGGKAFHLS